LLLKEQVESLIKSTHSNFDLLILDNASTDESAHQLSVLSGKDIRLSYKCYSDAGLDRINVPFMLADGTYVYIPHDDDITDPKWLKIATDFLDKHEDIGAVFCRYRYIDELGQHIDGQFENQPESVQRFDQMQLVNHFAMTGAMLLLPTAVYRLSTIRKCGISFPDISEVGLAQDMSFLFRLNVKMPVAQLPFTGYLYRRHSHQMSQVNGKLVESSMVLSLTEYNFETKSLRQQTLRQLADVLLKYHSNVLSEGQKIVMRLVRRVSMRLYFGDAIHQRMVAHFRHMLIRLIRDDRTTSRNYQM
jgi:glycosyltransferase involved in cell wall biosynthesis